MEPHRHETIIPPLKHLSTGAGAEPWRLERDEQACREWARRYGKIYIIAGPIFLNQRHRRIGKHKVAVPEAFFKVVLCLEGQPKAIGFICRNTDGNRKKDAYVNTLAQVERITGYRFFPTLPAKMRQAIETTADLSDW